MARVNGEERAQLDLGALAYAWQELAEHAARNTALRPGDLLVCSVGSSGGPWLEPGDVVELELAGVGVLRNRVAGGVAAKYTPRANMQRAGTRLASPACRHSEIHRRSPTGNER